MKQMVRMMAWIGQQNLYLQPLHEGIGKIRARRRKGVKKYGLSLVL